MTREEARQGLQGYSLFIADGTDLKEALNMAIEALQTEVVRCKDCKYYDESLEVCRCSQWDLSRIEYPMVGADDFCSYGERKE